VPTIANDLLQFNFYQMTSDLWRFGINSTIGIGGLFDVATRINLPYYSNDFGLTLASWGYRSSNYLVLPFFGPNTIRDSLSIPVDYYGFSIYPYISPTSVRYEVYGVGIVDRRANLLQYQPVFEEAAIDKYVFMRNAYLQRRNHQIKQNQQLSAKDRVAAGKSVPFASDENSN
jgi:phospholipid-binding lipoprotein MlaA